MKKWSPSKSAKRAFAIRMQDPNEQAAYQERKEVKKAKRRSGSAYDYSSAGGNYVPTKAQCDAAMIMPDCEAARHVIQGYTCQEKIHHDHIHVVNEFIRKQAFTF